MHNEVSPPSRTLAIVAILVVLLRAATLMFVAVTRLVAVTAIPDWEWREGGSDLVGVVLGFAVSGGAIISLLALLLAALVFVVWLHGAVRHARSYGHPQPDATPWGAVACWFIPFVNLVRPYLVVQSLYRTSRAHAQVVPGDLVTRWPLLLPIWWATWLLGNILTNVYSGLWSKAHTAPEAWVGVIAATVTLLAASCAAVIVASVQAILSAANRARFRSEDAGPGEFEPARFAVDAGGHGGGNA